MKHQSRADDGMDAQPGAYGGGDGGIAPPQSNMHSTTERLVLIVSDADCVGTAEALVPILKRDMSNRVALEIEFQPLADGASHRDALQMLLSKYPNIATSHVFVVSFIKDGNPEQYKNVKQWAGQFKTALNSHVITCVNAMTDPSLLIRNVGKAIVLKLTA
eukprot:TRINITY_DN21054_c0_g1_i1.p1 TRINITY_DN21054_c0_g1~~TRINITY_DN21054_c0_g1_i1.p1  ORF type:complete len:161 (+),score=45.70 TRINITY_DN21054_c0_g1_i1:33-515(+)